MLSLQNWPDWILRGTSAAAERLKMQVERVAPHFRTALVVGEAGCMKAELARVLHAKSPLREHTLSFHSGREFRCESLDWASRGTVYLADVGEVRPEEQLALIHRMRQCGQGRRGELRFVFGSDVASRGLVAAGRLEPELAACVSAVEIRVAPLRERLDDLPLLLENFEMTASALEHLASYSWPGNFRELQAVVSGALARSGGGPIEARHLPPLVSEPPGRKRELRLEMVVRGHVLSVLEGCAGNKLRAAELLGISRSTLYRMLEAG